MTVRTVVQFIKKKLIIPPLQKRIDFFPLQVEHLLEIHISSNLEVRVCIPNFFHLCGEPLTLAMHQRVTIFFKGVNMSDW